MGRPRAARRLQEQEAGRYDTGTDGTPGDRPTGECCSFPSGHAATAFAVAAVLERHLSYRAAWPTLVAATYVGASRLHDNRHFLSDVVFGSAIGMATGWTIVGRHGRSEYALLPVPVRGGFALNLMRAPQHAD